MASSAPERYKVEQIMVEFFAKSLHIILESRIPALGGEGDYLGTSASSSTSGPKTRDRWFNLALGDCTAALENFEPCRRSFSDPMVVDILLEYSKPVERKPSLPRDWPKGGLTSQDTLQGPSSTCSNSKTVLERWIVQLEQRKKSRSRSSSPKERTGAIVGPGWDAKTSEPWMDIREKQLASGSGSRSQKTRIDSGETAARAGGMLPAHVTEVSAVYKRTVVMLRSLYSRCRLLPAYRMFRILSSPTNCCDFSLSYRVLSSVSALSEHEKQDMSLYSFTPVETAFGRMCLSVAYRLKTSVIAVEVVPSILPRIIPDYVGSPTTDFLKRFVGEPHSLPSAGTSIDQGMHVISIPSYLQNSPPGFGLGRRHSWSGRLNQMQPALQPPSSPSYRTSRSPSPCHPFHPSPPYPPSPYSPFSQKHASSDLSFSPLSSPLSSADHHLSTKLASSSQPISIDTCCSPPFSPSPSPSPPTLYRGSDPVSIPRSSCSRGSKLIMGDTHQRSRNLLPPLSPSSKKTGVLQRCSSESLRYAGQLVPHAHQSRSFESPMHFRIVHADHGQQAWMNEGTLPFLTENLVCGHSQTTLSRSSSKAADNGEDEDFSCPFAVDDVDAEEKRSGKTDCLMVRGEAMESSTSSGSLQQVSQDAAVGALILVFKSALPLRHSPFTSGEVQCASWMFRAPSSLVSEGGVQPTLEPLTCTHKGKMAAEALEELQHYKNMRNLMRTRKGEVAG